jgi:ABC-type multidrug transport system ATPase subunit
MIYGVSGMNGSGKTTLLQMLAGLIPPSKGQIQYWATEQLIPEENWYQYVSYAAPYADVYEYMNLSELFYHYKSLKVFEKEFCFTDFVELVYLQSHEHKLIKTYSSGMKQRLKLGLSILSRSGVLFLDEPQSNLDQRAKEWFCELLKLYRNKKIIIIASNETQDFEIADKIISLDAKSIVT